MKGIMIVLLLLILLFLCCMLSFWYIDKTAAELDRMLERTAGHITGEQWKEAAAELEAVRDRWERISARWKVLIDHDDIRDIEISMVDLAAAISLQDGDEAEKEMKALRYFLKHVPENEKIAFYNIL